ncbi:MULTISPECIES: hypothetical protein [unclassified Novosphingobium]|uniref:hypothetical protein n=1 Tax=unclassified Novosphingobium TaxID=2644732 RepID=UPI00146C49E5|nr:MULTISPECIES: hypothetical protein [unclassified Novosphingobium]NMN03904.1 hypothetical protein [Novosphingobium sp. SG919]NMN86106.1 hypothetical protein [Novosphingobium sp. SG916]
MHYPCPDYLEIEDEPDALIPAVHGRVYRTTVEAIIGRPLRDRSDFVGWMDEHHDRIVQAAFRKALGRPVRPVGSEPYITIDIEDLTQD